MRQSIKKGLGFGLTSGIITTLGLIVGLNSSTANGKVILGGIFIIAVADALSDALGMHMSEESNSANNERSVWLSTISTFVAKLFFALTFSLPFLFLSINSAIILAVAWGGLLLILFSVYIAKAQKLVAYKVVGEHLLIALFVLLATNYIGKLFQ